MTGVTSESLSKCAGCSSKPCIGYSDDELSASPVGNFLYNPKKDVCVTNAISIVDGAHPKIDDDCCFGCGLCLLRCPFDVIQWEIESPLPLVGGDGESVNYAHHMNEHPLDHGIRGENRGLLDGKKKKILVRNLLLSISSTAAMGRGLEKDVLVFQDRFGDTFVIRCNWDQPDPEHVRQLAFDDIPRLNPRAGNVNGLLIIDTPISRNNSAPIQIAEALEKWPPYHELMWMSIGGLEVMANLGVWLGTRRMPRISKGMSSEDFRDAMIEIGKLQ